LYRGINELKKGHQPGTNIVKDEKCDLVADSQSILARGRKYFSQLLNVHGVNDVRQTEIHTAEPLVFEPSAFAFELAIGKLKVTNHRVSIKFKQNCFKQGVEQFTKRYINLLFVWNKGELREEWKELIIAYIYKTGDKKIVIIIGAYYFGQLCTKFYPSSCSQHYLYMQRKLLGYMGG
jgi:hypothetical protein